MSSTSGQPPDGPDGGELEGSTPNERNRNAIEDHEDRLYQVARAAAQIVETQSEPPFQYELDSGQVDRVLENADEADKRAHRRSQAGLFCGTAIVIGIFLSILCLCWMFLSYGRAELLEKVVTAIVSAAGGGAIGYGTGYSRGRKAMEDRIEED